MSFKPRTATNSSATFKPVVFHLLRYIIISYILPIVLVLCHVFQLSQNCQYLQHLDLSYCNGLKGYPDNEYLWTLTTSLTSLSLCGVLLDDETLFVECIQRLKRLKSIRLSGVPALNDDTFAQVNILHLMMV